MKFRLALLLAASAPAFAGSPTWTPIPTPQTPVYIQQVQPDYARSVGDGFSEAARAIEALGHRRQRAAAATPPAVTSTVSEPVISPNGTRFHQVGNILYVTRPDGTNLVCQNGTCN